MSLAAAAAGGRVTATDWAPDSITLLERNAARNALKLEVLCVDWSAPEEIVARAPWDLGRSRATCSTSRATGSALLPLLPRLIDQRGEIWLADPGRKPAGPFLERAAETFTIETRAAKEIPQGAIHKMRLAGSRA